MNKCFNCNNEAAVCVGQDEDDVWTCLDCLSLSVDRIPNPGSDKAIKMGCTCAVIDNEHGRGMYIDDKGHPVFSYDMGCPLHGTQIQEAMAQQAQQWDTHISLKDMPIEEPVVVNRACVLLGVMAIHACVKR